MIQSFGHGLITGIFTLRFLKTVTFYESDCLIWLSEKIIFKLNMLSILTV